MNSRFYLVTIQHNKEKDAENRTVPTAFDNYFKAETEYHKQLGKDRDNATLDWGVVYLIDNLGNKLLSERWSKPVVVEIPTVEEVAEEKNN